MAIMNFLFLYCSFTFEAVEAFGRLLDCHHGKSFYICHQEQVMTKKKKSFYFRYNILTDL